VGVYGQAIIYQGFIFFKANWKEEAEKAVERVKKEEAELDKSGFTPLTEGGVEEREGEGEGGEKKEVEMNRLNDVNVDLDDDSL